MSVADRMGFGPKRETTPNADGTYTITVTPPAFSGSTTTHNVKLSDDQYPRYVKWLHGEGMIQDLLGDLSPLDRELLMSGLSDDDFEAFSEDDEPEDDDGPEDLSDDGPMGGYPNRFEPKE